MVNSSRRIVLRGGLDIDCMTFGWLMGVMTQKTDEVENEIETDNLMDAIAAMTPYPEGVLVISCLM